MLKKPTLSTGTDGLLQDHLSQAISRWSLKAGVPMTASEIDLFCVEKILPFVASQHHTTSLTRIENKP